jgi:acetyl esterase/lipase
VLRHPNIKPIQIGGIWFPQAPSFDDVQTRTFVLHLPGGAHVVAFSPAQTGQAPGATYARKLNALIFFAQYRMANTSASRFPAALQDAVTFYSHLLDMGIPPKNILIAWDSVGGNLVLALLRYIEANPSLLSRPRGALVWSPWVNLTPEAVISHQKSAKNSTDLVPCQILQWGLEAYPPPSSDSSVEVDSYISPAQHPFSTSIPLMLQVGTAEVFHTDVESFARAMAGKAGNRVKYHETPYAPHDLILCGKIMGLQKETDEVVEVARDFFGLR